MAVTYQTEGVKMPDIKKRETTEWIKNVAASYGKRLGEIAYIFCSDEKILEVNRQYLQHDYYTDIITFDYCQGDRLSGDLFISLDTIRTNAEQFGAAYDDELHRVIIHGILILRLFHDFPFPETFVIDTRAVTFRTVGSAEVEHVPNECTPATITATRCPQVSKRDSYCSVNACFILKTRL